MDVVSEGNHDDWTYDPFTLTENQGYLYGRGAADMKSGLAALAIALIEIKESGKLTQGTIKFMATVGEEMEQSGSQQLFEKGYADDLDALLIAEPSFLVWCMHIKAQWILELNLRDVHHTVQYHFRTKCY